MRKKLIFTIILISLITILLVFFFINKKGIKDIHLIEKQRTVSGKVVDFSFNPNFDIDGIILLTNNQKITLRFPPHTAKKIMESANKGENIDVLYSEEYHPFEKETIGRLISIKGNNKSFNFEDYKPTPPDLHEGKAISIIIKNYKFNIDDKNNPNAILADGYYIDVKPHILRDVSVLMKNGNNIEVSGFLRNDSDGFINYYRYKFIKAESIKIDDKTYLLK